VTLFCKGFTCEGELGKYGRDSQVMGRFVVSAHVSVVSHIGKV
jgi:hypothetical protein